MPFPFSLPTTSHVTFDAYFSSGTHPALISSTNTARSHLRSVLKQHKRLKPHDKPTDLPGVLAAASECCKYLSTLDAALSGESVAGEDIDLVLVKEVELEWRPTLNSSFVPGREVEKVKGQGLDYDYHFVHQVLAEIQNLLARQALLQMCTTSAYTPEHRLGLIQTATKHLRTAYSIHTHLMKRADTSDGRLIFPIAAADISFGVQSALQKLAQAEFNLLSALKDDPFPALLAQARNESDREWMIRAPEIPKTRAQVLTRLCVGAGDLAGIASSMLTAEKRILKDLIEFSDDLRRTARARACRFQAIDADARGETGRGLAWIRAGLSELGLEIRVESHSSRSSTFTRLKASINEKREDRRVEKGSLRWGSDAGRAEEQRILEYLEKKMIKANDTLHMQRIPEHKPLVALLPGGMKMPIEDERWEPVLLSEEELAVMRLPPDPGETRVDDDDSSNDGHDDEHLAGLPGRFGVR